MDDSQRKQFTEAIAALCASFGTDASVALYNGYWLGQLNAKGELKPFGGKLTLYTTDSTSGAVTASTFVRKSIPKNGIPNN